jgi:hypothetical protein
MRTASLVVALFVAVPTLARAADGEPPTTLPPIAGTTAPAPSTLDPTAWDARYADARTKLLDGQFDVAAADLEELARVAPDEARRALAAEDATLARTWARKGLVIVRRSDLADESVTAKATDRRTTDEIAVLYTNAVFYGLGTGAWLAVQTEPSDAAGGILPALAFGGGSAGLVALLDSGRGLRYGVPQSITTGLYLGLEEGLVWTLYNQASASWRDEWSGKTVATVIWGSATLGAVVGGVLGQTYGTTPGRASYVGSTSLWTSTLLGLAMSAVIDHSPSESDDHILLSMALGLNAGALVGVFTARDVSPSVARVRYLDLGAIAGGIVSAGLFVAGANGVRDDQWRAFSAVTGLGIGGGLIVSWMLTRNMPQDRNEPSKSVLASVVPSLAPTRGGATFTLSGSF